MPLRAALLLAIAFTAAPLAARNVIFVDNARAGGAGTYERPFATLSEAAGKGVAGDVIYVAEGNAPYEGGIALKAGQQLIGAAEGLDVPFIAAVQGPGPTIHGGVWMQGDNVVAGCTIVVETGSGIGAAFPTGPLAIRKTFIRASKQAFGMILRDCTSPVTIDGGGIVAAGAAGGVAIDGGSGDIVFDRFPIAGTFVSAIAVSNRSGGAVKFRNGSKIAVDDATKAAIVVESSQGIVAFDSPLRIATHGARGFVVMRSHHVEVTGGGSRIASVNAAAIEIHDAGLLAAFDSVSAGGAIAEGIVVDKVHGKLAIGSDSDVAGSGGAIRDATAGAVRIEQSSGVTLASMTIAGSGTALSLRHLSKSKFAAIDISGGGGIAARNLSDVAFDRVTIANSATAAVSLHEATGPVAFTRCTIADANGPALVVEQRFDHGNVTFDRGEISAAGRPAAAPFLVDVRTSGGSKLRVGFDSLRLHESSGSAISASASDSSALTLDIAQSYAQGLGGSFVEAAAHQSARVAVIVHDTHVDFPANRETALVSVNADDRSEGCADFAANALLSGGSVPRVRLRTAATARMMIAGAAPAAGQSSDGTVFTPVPSCR